MPLHAIVGAHNQNRVVERAQCALCLGRKIHVTGGVHKHDVGISVVEHGLRRENRDAALAFDSAGIQVRVAVVHTAALANATRVEQHGLGQRSLAGIDMRQDSNARLLRHGPRSTLDDTIYGPAGEAGPIPRPSSSPRVAARRFS